MAKRKYTKKSSYWEKFNQPPTLSESEFTPIMAGSSLFDSVSEAACSRSGERSKSRSNAAASGKISNKYKNIEEGLLPYNYSGDDVDVSEAIELCQKAYFNVPVFGVTIDLMADYADLDLYLKGGSKKSRAFIEAWFKKIRIHDLKAQFFREFFRSGNVFLYRLDATIAIDSVAEFQKMYGGTRLNSKLPIKYVTLNPSDITARGALMTGEHEYFKMLTKFEESKLENPSTKHERELANSLEKKGKGFGQKSFLPLKGDKLYTVFSKKQDYEPLAVPRGFCVLDDINKKMELKKVDQAIARSIENVVLLITMGDEPEKGGVNPKAVSAMQEIFQNQSVGRVLVSDYTTKGQFIIPDLKKVMGKEKYEILNQDIQDGLQNFLFGESKYSDMNFKIKAFHKKLECSRKSFIQDFLQGEIERICDDAGMRSFPEVYFKQPSEVSDSDKMKLATRMIELGVITPEQGMDVFETGEMPSAEEMDEAQEEFTKKRTKGHYMPLVNTVNLLEGEEEESGVEEAPEKDGGLVKKAKDGKEGVPSSPSPSGGRPSGVSNSHFSKNNIIEVTKATTELELSAFREFAVKYGLEELSEQKKEVVGKVCESIVASTPLSEWSNKLDDIIKDMTIIESLDCMPEVLEVGGIHGLDIFASSILHHSTQL